MGAIEKYILDDDIEMKINIKILKTDYSVKMYGTFGAFYLIVSLVTSTLQMYPLCRFFINENDWLLQFSVLGFGTTYVILFIGRENKCLKPIFMTLLMFLQMSGIVFFVIINTTLGVLHSLWLTAFMLLMAFFHVSILQRCCNFYKTLFISLLLSIPVAVSLQVVLGCSIEELVISLCLSTFLTLYHIYIISIVLKDFSVNEYFSALLYVYLWPVIYFFAKCNVSL